MSKEMKKQKTSQSKHRSNVISSILRAIASQLLLAQYIYSIEKGRGTNRTDTRFLGLILGNILYTYVCICSIRTRRRGSKLLFSSSWSCSAAARRWEIRLPSAHHLKGAIEPTRKIIHRQILGWRSAEARKETEFCVTCGVSSPG